MLNKIRKYILLMGLLAVTACGPTKEHIAAENAKRDAKIAETSALIASLRARAARRKSIPVPDDPGYAITRCYGIEPVPKTISGSGSIAFDRICGNSVEAQAILDYRKGYCSEIDSIPSRVRCVTRKWTNGEPTFEQPRDSFSRTTNLSIDNNGQKMTLRSMHQCLDYANASKDLVRSWQSEGAEPPDSPYCI